MYSISNGLHAARVLASAVLKLSAWLSLVGVLWMDLARASFDRLHTAKAFPRSYTRDTIDGATFPWAQDKDHNGRLY
jgi:hypothetical protein